MAGKARRIWVICLILIGLLAAGAYYAVARPKRAQPAAPAAGPRAVPVVTDWINRLLVRKLLAP